MCYNPQQQFFIGDVRKKLLCVVCVSAAMLIPVFASAGAKEYEYTEQDIFITAGDHEIPATLTLPKGKADEKFPAVVMLHGNGSNRHEAGMAYDYTAPEMARAGIATIRFDYIGNGDSKGD